MLLSLQTAIGKARDEGHKVTLSPRIGEALICRARQNALVDFMRSDCEYLFTVDDDIEVPSGAIVDLIAADKDIIGGAYRLKNLNEINLAIRIPNNRDWPDILKYKMVAPAIYVSTGCMLVKKECIEEMIFQHPELKYKRNILNDTAWALYMPFIYEKEYLSEDWAFCRRALNVNKSVWVHGGVLCAHWVFHKLEIDEE